MPVDVRKGQCDVKLTREEFERRLRERFYDPEFQAVQHEVRNAARALIDAVPLARAGRFPHPEGESDARPKENAPGDQGA
jgi:hypothetical protein